LIGGPSSTLAFSTCTSTLTYVITGALIFILINLVVDILYHYLDPRVRINDKSR
jgi:ABC-type dipeptide/oligopeptide/nickel transport system permease component